MLVNILVSILVGIMVRILICILISMITNLMVVIAVLLHAWDQIADLELSILLLALQISQETAFQIVKIRTWFLLLSILNRLVEDLNSQSPFFCLIVTERMF